VQPSGVEEVQYQLDHLHLLDVDGLLCRHDYRRVVAACSWLENRKGEADRHVNGKVALKEGKKGF